MIVNDELDRMWKVTAIITFAQRLRNTTKYFSQDIPGAHPASCSMGTGGPFPGAEVRPGRDADHLPPYSAEVNNE
jgi:hypothetical protein